MNVPNPTNDLIAELNGEGNEGTEDAIRALAAKCSSDEILSILNAVRAGKAKNRPAFIVGCLRNVANK